MVLAEKSNDNQSLANGYFILGTIFSNAGEFDKAIKQYEKARAGQRQSGFASLSVDKIAIRYKYL